MQPVWIRVCSCKSIKGSLKIHSGEKSNKCNQCDYVSIQAGNLRTHILRKHINVDGIFSRASHLKRHIGEKSLKCSHCNFISTELSKLKMHLKTHIGEKSDTNKQHGFSSGQEDNLKTNSKTHFGKKSKRYKAIGISMDPLLRGCIEEMLEKQDWIKLFF